MSLQGRQEERGYLRCRGQHVQVCCTKRESPVSTEVQACSTEPGFTGNVLRPEDRASRRTGTAILTFKCTVRPRACCAAMQGPATPSSSGMCKIVTSSPWLHKTSLNDMHSLRLMDFVVAKKPLRNQQIILLVSRVLHRYHQACHGNIKCYA